MGEQVFNSCGIQEQFTDYFLKKLRDAYSRTRVLLLAYFQAFLRKPQFYGEGDQNRGREQIGIYLDI